MVALSRRKLVLVEKDLMPVVSQSKSNFLDLPTIGSGNR